MKKNVDRKIQIDKVKVNNLVKKRVYPYLYSIIFFILLIIGALLIANFVGSRDTLKILSLILVVLTFLTLFIVAGIYDFGAAAKIRKNNFVIKDVKNKETVYIFYTALKKIGLIRIFINLLLISVPLIFGITSFIG